LGHGKRTWQTLRKDEQVTHINGIKDDNRPENLQIRIRKPPIFGPTTNAGDNYIKTTEGIKNE